MFEDDVGVGMLEEDTQEGAQYYGLHRGLTSNC